MKDDFLNSADSSRSSDGKKMKTTLCWNCSGEYDESDAVCKHCGSTNGNINFEQAVSESNANTDKDALRYRWLRDQMTHERSGPNYGWTIGFVLPGDDPDAAIDAAMNKAAAVKFIGSRLNRKMT